MGFWAWRTSVNAAKTARATKQIARNTDPRRTPEAVAERRADLDQKLVDSRTRLAEQKAARLAQKETHRVQNETRRAERRAKRERKGMNN